jgi:hypothetical protein
MNEGGLTTQVKDFVIRHITSIEQLELLLLFASRPEKSWTIRQLVDEIRSSHESVSQRVDQLQAAGFLAEEAGVFRFTPGPPEQAALVGEVARAYRGYRERLAELIYGRTRVLKNFSDAFKLRPKE